MYQTIAILAGFLLIYSAVAGLVQVPFASVKWISKAMPIGLSHGTAQGGEHHDMHNE